MGFLDTASATLKSLFGRRTKYTSLPSDDNVPLPSLPHGQPGGKGEGEGEGSGFWHRRHSAALKSTMGVLSLAIIGYLIWYSVSAARAVDGRPQRCDTPEQGFQCSANISHSWGQYSPYFSVPSEIDPAVPEGCKLTFAQILSRHGARAPTLGKSLMYRALVAKIHLGAREYGPGYEFLQHYHYTLGADQLTPFGQQHMVRSGVKFYQRYGSLARTTSTLPFVRSSGQDRVVDSARNWTQGFHRALLADYPGTPPSLPYPMLIIPERPGTNNTLNNKLCTPFTSGKYSTIGASASDTFLSVFAPPITARVNSNLPGANLSLSDTALLMDLCPFLTVSQPPYPLPLPPLCALFTPTEWADYDYYLSLGKWYGFGPGNPLGPTQGVGWVNELIARLTGVPVVDRTSTNGTLDGDERTFPLGRVLYADFSHDNDMMGVVGALGVYEGVKGLEKTRREGADQVGGFAASWTVPFAARIYVEKMTCGGGGGEMVRVLVNDRVVRLAGCGADELGRCELGRFVKSLDFARKGGKWDLCFK